MIPTNEPPDHTEPLRRRVANGLRGMLVVYPAWEPDLSRLVRNLAVVISVSCVLMSIVDGLLMLGPAPVLINLGIPVFVLAGILLIRRSGRFLGAFLFIIVGVFLTLLPFGFFIAGGPAGSFPYYFLIGVAVTALMLQGLRLYLALTLEIAAFVGCVQYGVDHPGSFLALPAEGLERSLPACLLLIAVEIALVVHSVYRFYLRTALELARCNGRLAQAARHKDAFLATAAHELKTPMAIMSSHAQEARRLLGGLGQPSDELVLARRDLETIMNQAESLSAMVSQLLDLSRADEGHLVLTLHPVALAEVLQTTLAECAPLCAENGNTLQLARGGAYPRVMADPARLGRVLINLIANATRHTRGGAITISVVRREAVACVSVEDTGEGMTSEALETVLRDDGSTVAPLDNGRLRPALDPEQRLAAALVGGDSGGRASRADSASQSAELVSPPIPTAGGSRHGGLGLGLRLVRHIVEAHGGEFTLASEPGKGTRASFTLPLAP
ncbi:MAG: HAMP domain-containing histidine kinase [Bifidobacteriaceae bacterium]|jgi:signal transduction histidine kinase|nr:HAMP domain-containing histidine kinase [Bifidobacteriaceae bacterium]